MDPDLSRILLFFEIFKSQLTASEKFELAWALRYLDNPHYSNREMGQLMIERLHERFTTRVIREHDPGQKK